MTEATSARDPTPPAEQAQVSTVAPSPTTSIPTPETAGANSTSTSSLTTPTLGPLVTRTPAPSAACPARGSPPAVSFEELSGAGPDEPEQPILKYLNGGGAPGDLAAMLTGLRAPPGLDEGEGGEPVLAQVVTQDVTGDTTPDVLVTFTVPYGRGYGATSALIAVCNQERYEMYVMFRRAGAGSRAEGLYTGGGAGILAVEDVNQDAVPEVVLQVLWTDQAEFYVYEWNGSGFDNLIRRYDDIMLMEFYNLIVYRGDVQVQDATGDGVPDLVLTDRLPPDYPLAFPERDRTEIWSWNGFSLDQVTTIFGPPKYRFQAIYDGDDASRIGEYDRALALYQQAIFDEELLGWNPGYNPYFYNRDEAIPTPVPDPDSRLRLNAYGRYRILLLHAVQGFQAEARTVYDTLQEKFPEGSTGSKYAELATVFWQEFSSSGDIGLACSKAADFAETQSDVIHIPLGYDYYTIGNRAYHPEDICPFGT